MQYLAPNEWNEKAAGRSVVIVPLILFTDNTSGNRSKSGINMIHGIFYLQALVDMQMLSQEMYTFLPLQIKFLP